MEDRETARMRKYGESKTTQSMMATVPHVTSGKISGRDGFLLTQVYNYEQCNMWPSGLNGTTESGPHGKDLNATMCYIIHTFSISFCDFPFEAGV